MNVNTLVKAKRCVAIKAILPISVKTASLMLQHVHDSWLMFPSTIERLLMNAKNSDLQFLPLCERWFWKEVHNKKWVESHLQNCTRKEWRNDNVKTTAAFKMFFSNLLRRYAVTSQTKRVSKEDLFNQFY